MSEITIPETIDLATARRTFLRGAAFSLGGVGLLAATGAMAAGPAGDVTVLNVALGLEHEGIAAYTIAAGSGLLTPGVLATAGIFLGHHKGHRDKLVELIKAAGGTPVAPMSDADYVKALNLGALKTQTDVVVLAIKLEMGAANAYVGSIPALKDKSLAHLFAQISCDEATHWAILNTAAGNTEPAAPFIFG
jgi:hypothetical protein